MKQCMGYNITIIMGYLPNYYYYSLSHLDIPIGNFYKQSKESCILNNTKHYYILKYC